MSSLRKLEFCASIALIFYYFSLEASITGFSDVHCLVHIEFEVCSSMWCGAGEAQTGLYCFILLTLSKVILLNNCRRPESDECLLCLYCSWKPFIHCITETKLRKAVTHVRNWRHSRHWMSFSDLMTDGQHLPMTWVCFTFSSEKAVNKQSRLLSLGLKMSNTGEEVTGKEPRDKGHIS